MIELKSYLENTYSESELQKMATILNQKYRASYFFDGWKALDGVFLNNVPENLQNQLKAKCKYNDIFNYIIMQYGKTESIIKYYLTKEYIGNENEICLYEYPVGNSRVDFARINGKSYAYEIKTELDTTKRLQQQVNDYLSVFEYVNVVSHKKHIKKIRSIVPQKVGIIEYQYDGSEVLFRQVRVPKYNKGFKKSCQLENLSSMELKYIIKMNLNISVPEFKKQRLSIVNRKIQKQQLNENYKIAIKNSKAKKWEHIKTNFDVLRPIDIQYVYTDEYDIKLLI